MMSGGKSEGRALTAAMLRRKDRISLGQRPGTQRLGEALCSAVTQSAAAWNPVAIRVSVETISEETLAAANHPVRFNLNGRGGKVRVVAEGDKTLFLALTDLALGGTGTEPPAIAEDRPLSRIEEGIGGVFVTTLCQSVAPALVQHFGLEPLTPEAGGNEDDSSGTFLVFRLLANIFAYSGELRIAIHGGDLEAAIEASREAPDDGVPQHKIGGAVGDCVVEVTVALLPEYLSVGDVAGFRAGQVIPLQASARSPVNGLCADVSIFTGTLVRSGERVGLKIA